MDILEKLSDSRSYTSVAREFNISVSTVIRFFKNIRYNKPPKLPEVIGIDEFKGNSVGEKFHGILTDIGNRKVIDILKTRYEQILVAQCAPDLCEIADHGRLVLGQDNRQKHHAVTGILIYQR